LWKKFNRPRANETVIMSMCLGRVTPAERKEAAAYWNAEVIKGNVNNTEHVRTQNITGVLSDVGRYYAG
jgi:hypothetical protein